MVVRHRQTRVQLCHIKAFASFHLSALCKTWVQVSVGMYVCICMIGVFPSCHFFWWEAEQGALGTRVLLLPWLCHL